MAENSKIEWTDHTFNPWIGCTKVGPGCDHCYAEAREDTRLHRVRWGAGQPRHRTSNANWKVPLRWNKRHAEFFATHGRRQRVFCASLADVFDNEVDAAWRADLFELIGKTPNLDWLLLTKRIGNANGMITAALARLHLCGWDLQQWPWPNVWLGATITSQEEADRDIPKLLATPARVRFLSMEPLLGPVALPGFNSETSWCPVCKAIVPDSLTAMHENTHGPGLIDQPFNAALHCSSVYDLLNWVIVGGESGRGARPMHSELVRMLRDQCDAAGVPFLFKQWGEFLPGDADANDPAWPDVPDSRLYWIDGSKWDRFDGQRAGVSICAKVGKEAAGRLLDGVEHNGFPEVA